MAEYKTVVTLTGQSKIANAAATGTKVDITHIAVGDGGGSAVTPSENMTGLVNEVWRGAIQKYEKVNDRNIDIQAIIPADVGGWTAREMAAIDSDGDIIAVSNMPETEKTLSSSGAGTEITLVMRLSVSNAESVTVTINSTILFATLEELGKVQTMADTAQKAAENAQTAADNAGTAASNAQTAADNAGTAASNAQTAAETAGTNASNALTSHNTDTTAHQDIRNELKLKADLKDGKILDTQLPDMDYVPTSRMINGVALTKDMTLTAADVSAAALDLSNVENDVFYKKAKEAGMGQTYFFLHITFSPYLVGETYTITGGNFSYSGTVPTNLEAIIAVSEENVSFTVSCQNTSITVKPTYFGVYDVALVPVLANVSWAYIAKTILTNSIPSNWAIGDTKDITLTTGETITLQIYDFNHDDLADGTGKAGITFGMKNLMVDKRQMNSTGNKGSFTGSEMYTWLTGDLWNSLPDDLKSVIKPISKQTSEGNKSSTINTETMSIFLFSEVEVAGTTERSYSGEGRQYPTFTDDASRIKYLSNGTGEAYEWWLRSPYNGNSVQIGCVTSKGATSARSSTESIGVCFGFCV